MDKIIGIYKITNPIGHVYIGQSVDIYRRWLAHKCNPRVASTSDLGLSISKYGFDSHLLEIIKICDPNELNFYERYYQDLFDCAGENGLNAVLTATNDKNALYSPRLISKKAFIVLDKQTGTTYSGLKAASDATNISISRISHDARLNENRFTYTNK